MFWSLFLILILSLSLSLGFCFRESVSQPSFFGPFLLFLWLSLSRSPHASLPPAVLALKCLSRLVKCQLPTLERLFPKILKRAFQMLGVLSIRSPIFALPSCLSVLVIQTRISKRRRQRARKRERERDERIISLSSFPLSLLSPAIFSSPPCSQRGGASQQEAINTGMKLITAIIRYTDSPVYTSRFSSLLFCSLVFSLFLSVSNGSVYPLSFCPFILVLWFFSSPLSLSRCF